MKDKKTFDEIQPIKGELSNIKKERESILQTEFQQKGQNKFLTKTVES